MKRPALTLLSLATLVVAVVVLAFGLAACGGDGAGGSTPTATVTVTATPTVEPTGEPGATMTVSLYFLRGETLGVAHRAVPATGAPATAAMNVLLAGPDTRERAAGLGTTIPDGVVLHGIVIDSETKIATVDLGDRFAAGDGALSLRARVAEVRTSRDEHPEDRKRRGERRDLPCEDFVARIEEHRRDEGHIERQANVWVFIPDEQPYNDDERQIEKNRNGSVESRNPQHSRQRKGNEHGFVHAPDRTQGGDAVQEQTSEQEHVTSFP